MQIQVRRVGSHMRGVGALPPTPSPVPGYDWFRHMDGAKQATSCTGRTNCQLKAQSAFPFTRYAWGQMPKDTSEFAPSIAPIPKPSASATAVAPTSGSSLTKAQKDAYCRNQVDTWLSQNPKYAKCVGNKAQRRMRQECKRVVNGEHTPQQALKKWGAIVKEACAAELAPKPQPAAPPPVVPQVQPEYRPPPIPAPTGAPVELDPNGGNGEVVQVLPGYGGDTGPVPVAHGVAGPLERFGPIVGIALLIAGGLWLARSRSYTGKAKRKRSKKRKKKK